MSDDELNEGPGGRCIELDAGALAGLRKMPVDIFDNVYVGEVKPEALVLVLDIRNFSDFLCDHDEAEVFGLIREFSVNMLSCFNQFGWGCSYYKLMGDGAFVVWDQASKEAVDEALAIFDTYTDFVNEELFGPYPSLGLAGALVQEKLYKYEISAEASELKYRDYVGYGINLACRLQTLAVKDELIINARLAKSGFLPVRFSEDPSLIGELWSLKGLKPEDREKVLYYQSRQ